MDSFNIIAYLAQNAIKRGGGSFKLFSLMKFKLWSTFSNFGPLVSGSGSEFSNPGPRVSNCGPHF
jgi:hypothetical protein